MPEANFAVFATFFINGETVIVELEMAFDAAQELMIRASPERTVMTVFAELVPAFAFGAARFGERLRDAFVRAAVATGVNIPRVVGVERFGHFGHNIPFSFKFQVSMFGA